MPGTNIERAAELLRNSSYSLALTGAGVSTESGLPDYRSQETGLWRQVDPMKKASLSALLANPSEFYSWNLPRWIAYIGAKPNTAHYALAKLEMAGYIKGVITQNIDGLHYKAGSKRVWEVHGHLRTFSCIKCKHKYPTREVVKQYNDGINPPLCNKCRSFLRPDVVLFEDAMPEDYLQARNAMKNCQLLLVAGTSLRVYPVAGLPDFSEKLVIVNREETPFDKRAEVVIRRGVEDFFADLLSVLGL